MEKVPFKISIGCNAKLNHLLGYNYLDQIEEMWKMVNFNYFAVN